MIKLNLSLPTIYTRLLVGICMAGLFVLSSCGTTRRYSYLKTIQSDTTIRNFVTRDLESKIVPGDQLAIKVTSLSPAEDEQFNKAAAVTSSESMNGFAVTPEGSVMLHRLGQVRVSGLTRRELAKKLEKDLLPWMKEPIVNVNYLNHKITVIGAVSAPQVLQMPEEQLNIFEVLVKSGDIKPTGMKDRVMIIRDIDKDKKVKQINLEDHAIFTSPWYYVQPNDIVFVPEDNQSANRAEKKQQLQTTLAFVASGLSLVLIVADRIFR